MDPVYAATSFFIGTGHDRNGGLVKVAGWENMEPTVAIHKVQRNADPQHYTRFYALADQVIAQLGDSDFVDSCTNNVSEQDANDDYPWVSMPT